MTIADLNKALTLSWCRDTAYYSDRKDWSENNKALGQCTVTAMIVYDYFGGIIKRGYSPKYDLYHFWNEINGDKIDLTYSQFSKDKRDISFVDVITRDKKQLLKIANVRNRYRTLKKKVEEELVNLGLNESG